MWWGEIMPRQGGGQRIYFPPIFFGWLRQQIIMIDDWAYVGTYFQGDPDLPLPSGTQWADVGKNQFLKF